MRQQRRSTWFHMNQGCIDCHIRLWNGHSCNAHAIDVDDTASIEVSSAVDETVAVECSFFCTRWLTTRGGLSMYSLTQAVSDEMTCHWLSTDPIYHFSSTSEAVSWNSSIVNQQVNKLCTVVESFHEYEKMRSFSAYLVRPLFCFSAAGEPCLFSQYELLWTTKLHQQ